MSQGGMVLFYILTIFYVVVCMESSAMRPRAYLIVGPTGSGKSSFGASLSGKTDFARFRSIKGVQYYSVRREDFLSGAPSIFIELPNNTVDSVEDDKKNVQSVLSSQLLTGVHGVIILESLQEESVKLKSSIKRVHSIFGRGSTPSILVLLTKTDIRTSTLHRFDSLAELCKSESLPYMLWNNYDGIIYDPEEAPLALPLSEFQMEQQISELDGQLTK